MSIAKNASETIDFREIARPFLDDADNESAAAVDALVAHFITQPNWILEHAEVIIRSFWQGVANKMQNDSRRRTHLILYPKQEREVQAAVTAKALTAAIADNYERFMAAPLWGGKRIGDATPDEIRISANQFGLQAKTMSKQARWQLAVADAAEKNGIGPTDKISTSLSEGTLARLWEEVDAA